MHSYLGAWFSDCFDESKYGTHKTKIQCIICIPFSILLGPMVEPVTQAEKVKDTTQYQDRENIL